MNEVVRNYAKTALFVAINISAAWVLATVLGSGISRWVHLVLLGTATGLLLVAGIGGLGWSIQTIGGSSVPERLNQRIFYCLSYLGTFLLILEIFLK